MDSGGGNRQESEEDNQRGLTPEEVDKLVQLQDLTGLDDLEVCRALLESKQWDLDATAREHLNDIDVTVNNRDTPLRPRPPLPSTSAPNHISINNNNNNNNNSSLLSWSLYLLTLPVRWPFSMAFSFFSLLASFLGLTNNRRTITHGGGSGRDPLTEVQEFRDSLRKKYNLLLPFESSSYSGVLHAAKRDLMFLIAYLHSPNHQDTDRFCTQTLGSREFSEFLNRRRNDLLLWGCSIESLEGTRVSEALRENGFPFIAVIVLRQNKMMVVGRIQGFLTPGALIQRLEEIISDNEAFVVAARVDREERNLTQELRQEQDAAFQESLRLDQEKERQRREAASRLAAEAELEAQRLRQINERKERIARLKIEMAHKIPDEPDIGDPEVVKILIKLPEGQRLERRFKKSHSLESLYYFVFCHPDSPAEFDIMTNFPRKTLQCKPESLTRAIENEQPETEQEEEVEANNIPTFEEAGLGQSTMLFITDLNA